MVGVAQHEADIAVPQPDQMPGKGARRLCVVDEDAGAFVVGRVGRDANVRHPQPVERGDGLGRVGKRRGQDHAVEAQAGKDLFDLARYARLRIHRLDREVIAGFATAEQGADLYVADVHGRTAERWAEGVFLAAVGAERKPATLALLAELKAARAQAKTHD